MANKSMKSKFITFYLRMQRNGTLNNETVNDLDNLTKMSSFDFYQFIEKLFAELNNQFLLAQEQTAKENNIPVLDIPVRGNVFFEYDILISLTNNSIREKEEDDEVYYTEEFDRLLEECDDDEIDELNSEMFYDHAKMTLRKSFKDNLLESLKRLQETFDITIQAIHFCICALGEKKFLRQY